MKRLLILLLGVGLGAPGYAGPDHSSIDYPSIWECGSPKFNWYCDESVNDDGADPVDAPRSLGSLDRIEDLREELQRRENVAIMSPTTENMTTYLQAWQMVQDKASTFADVWRRTVWQQPDLDYAQRRPTNNVAVRVFDDQTRVTQERHLQNIARDHGLIFFFRGDCPYCHRMGPTLRMFANRYGLDVLGVSVDGGTLPDFPTPADGRAVAQAWGIERVPALFIAAKGTADHAAIGFGMMSLTEIVERIFVLTGTKAGERF